ncbi:nucleotide exchange factor GrpE [Roseobacter sinensis]|uniref:DNA repair protein n=1 Tax=Roseobacter sinensis TaxID=2931391 RepID=A0ABT3BGB2_9RHOB|nr:DNA repair protein [Roseobacter sp. WL0113]MCV3272424.1 DNA repair protein [Roseobacter sp. WL0113]
MQTMRPTLVATRTALQGAALTLICLATLAATTLSGLAAVGVVPWLELPLMINETAVPDGGLYLQLALTGLLLCLCVFLPTNRRVMQLESAHHSFSMRMEDVARAYATVHAADRAGAFQAPSEFDAVKERITHLRNHPDLGGLEPDILEVAAQMSRISEDLAQTYSDERMERAYDFLRQRQQEIDSFQERLDHAKALHDDIRQWANRLEVDEDIARAQLNRMAADLNELLPELDLSSSRSTNSPTAPDRVVRLSNVAAE